MNKLKEKLTWRRKLQLLPMPILAGLFIGLISGAYVFGLPENTVVVTQEKEVRVDYSLEEKTEELKQELLDDLKQAEVGGYEGLSAIITFDPLQRDLNSCRQIGGVRLHCYSFGVYQFKVATVQHFYERYYQYTPTDKESIDIALDYEKARELAYLIIFDENKGGVWHWRNSALKIDAPERIEFIRQLEQ